jgi:steroid delta-isomerase-like uncharacterized protein
MPDPTETRALIHRFVEAFNDRSIEGMLACVSEDVAFDAASGNRSIGRPEMEAALLHRIRRYREAMADAVVLVSEDGHRAAVEYTLRGAYTETDAGLPAATGQTFSVMGGSFFEVDDGMISRASMYYNVKQLQSEIGR